MFQKVGQIFFSLYLLKVMPVGHLNRNVKLTVGSMTLELKNINLGKGTSMVVTDLYRLYWKPLEMIQPLRREEGRGG